MRKQMLLYVAGAALGCVVAHPVHAALPASDVVIAPVEIGPDLQKNLDKQYGAAEGARLQDCVTRGLERAMARKSFAVTKPMTIAVRIEDAKPTHPTFHQQLQQPSLDPLLSVSIGGARLQARLLAPDGTVLGTVEHKQYAMDLRDASLGATPWSDACNAIDNFARKVTRAAAAL
ncbi:MAG: hypothetical protein QM718_09740 [Steroidobacteraceae bacterium]